MINVEKVKKGLGKCWKFFAAKPAYAVTCWQCVNCGKRDWSSVPPTSQRCPATGQGHVWQRMSY